MTWGELKESVLALGFDDSTAYGELATQFITATNRAITFITATIRPIKDKYIISQYPIENLLGEQFDIVQYVGEDIEYSASDVAAYYFECDGNGTATLSNGTDTVTVNMTSTGGYQVYKGFISGDVTLTFDGTYSYNIRNVALYPIVRGNTTADIPTYSPKLKYDIKELTKDGSNYTFFRFSLNNPVQQGNYSSDKQYFKVEDYHIENRTTIVLDYAEIGQFEVWYEKIPTKITISTLDNYELELDTDTAELLPLLVAHYVWLDDDGDKAMLYLDEYNNLASAVYQSDNEKTEIPSYKNTSGWW